MVTSRQWGSGWEIELVVVGFYNWIDRVAIVGDRLGMFPVPGVGDPFPEEHREGICFEVGWVNRATEGVR